MRAWHRLVKTRKTGWIFIALNCSVTLVGVCNTFFFFICGVGPKYKFFGNILRLCFVWVARCFRGSVPYIYCNIGRADENRPCLQGLITISLKAVNSTVYRIVRLFTVLYFSVRSSRSSALRFGLPTPPPPPSYNPDARPLGTFENRYIEVR